MAVYRDDVLHRLSAQMNICRICLKYNTVDNPFYDIFVDKIQFHNIYDLLKNLFDINVEPDDVRPKFICKLCFDKVSEWREFISKAHHSQYCINEMVYATIKGDFNTQQPVSSSSSSVINILNGDDIDNQGNSNNNQSISSNSPSPSVINLSDDDQDNSNSSSSSVINISDDNQDSSNSSSSVNDISDVNNQDNSNINPSTSPSVTSTFHDNNKYNPSTSSAPINNLLNNENNQENSFCMPSTSTANSNIVKNEINVKPDVMYSCIIRTCAKSFNTYIGFQIHYRHHLNINKAYYICWKCNKTFYCKSVLNFHKKKEKCTFPLMFGCALCNESFDDLKSLSNHKYNVHV